ncbi:cupin domain-containing protein [Alicyclobacillus tolerans]|uniref:cupin domain-containing protein n=1 Tax=Alicyclobacillus tolerans TaxID=90970 RepID=UPI003B76D438
MKIFRFGRETGKTIAHFDSNFVMSRILTSDNSAHIGCMYLEPNGIVGFHEASCPQLLLVVSGNGWVRCDADELVPVGIGDAVFWDQGEWHETKTHAGLTAIVVEADVLNPAQFMPLRK